MFQPHQSDATAELPGSRAGSEAARKAAQLMRLVRMSPNRDRLGHEQRLARLDALIGCGAWTDAAIELQTLVAPGWHLQRLCRDSDEWICTLCRHPSLPEWLDETLEARGASPALAVLGTLAANPDSDAR